MSDTDWMRGTNLAGGVRRAGMTREERDAHARLAALPTRRVEARPPPSRSESSRAGGEARARQITRARGPDIELPGSRSARARKAA